MSLFDELGDESPNKINVKPFHIVKEKGVKELHEWCNKVIDTLQKQATTRKRD